VNKEAPLLHEPVDYVIGAVKVRGGHDTVKFRQHRRTQAMLVGNIAKYPFPATKEQRQDVQSTEEDDANIGP